jgi:hypothetical protein
VDAQFGELADVVIDPTTRCVTHLVVRPHTRPDDARIVPVDWATSEGTGPAIRLSATVAEVERLDPLHETAYLRLGEFPVDNPDWDVGVEDMLGLPYLQGIEAQPVEADPHVVVGYDRIPKGDVEIRRASAVTAADAVKRVENDTVVLRLTRSEVGALPSHRVHRWGRS